MSLSLQRVRCRTTTINTIKLNKGCRGLLILIYNIEKMKDEKIFVERGEIKRLAKIFDVTDEFVYMALRYARDSELARKIRYTALKPKADGGCSGEVWRRVK